MGPGEAVWRSCPAPRTLSPVPERLAEPGRAGRSRSARCSPPRPQPPPRPPGSTAAPPRPPRGDWPPAPGPPPRPRKRRAEPRRGAAAVPAAFSTAGCGQRPATGHGGRAGAAAPGAAARGDAPPQRRAQVRARGPGREHGGVPHLEGGAAGGVGLCPVRRGRRRGAGAAEPVQRRWELPPPPARWVRRWPVPPGFSRVGVHCLARHPRRVFILQHRGFSPPQHRVSHCWGSSACFGVLVPLGYGHAWFSLQISFSIKPCSRHLLLLRHMLLYLVS